MSDIDRLLEKLAAGTTTEEEARFLFTWLREHRDQWVFSMYAEYLIKLEKDQVRLESQSAEKILRQIHQRIEAEACNLQNTPTEIGKVVPHRFTLYYYLTAATVVLLLGMVGWWYANNGRQQQPLTTRVSIPEAMVEKINAESGIMPVALPDGSSVWLYPKSRIRYASALSGPQRKVSLWGKAFFEVNRNPDRPFIVSAREMVTEVLGTSFTVEAYDNQAQFLVTVKTGKVSVSAQRQTAEGQLPDKNASIAVVANQQAVFNRSVQKLTATTVQPKALAELIPSHPSTYKFRDTPVGEILSTLSHDYQVAIEWDEKVLAGCALTTTLRDKPFFEKLRIICEAIGPGTHYTTVGETIQITSLGCNN
jgi:transmembrane sensor